MQKEQRVIDTVCKNDDEVDLAIKLALAQIERLADGHLKLAIKLRNEAKPKTQEANGNPGHEEELKACLLVAEGLRLILEMAFPGLTSGWVKDNKPLHKTTGGKRDA